MRNGTMLDELASELGMDALDVMAIFGETCAGEIVEALRVRTGRRIEPVEEALLVPSWEARWVTGEPVLLA
jgi:hypothetical protein